MVMCGHPENCIGSPRVTTGANVRHFLTQLGNCVVVKDAVTKNWTTHCPWKKSSWRIIEWQEEHQLRHHTQDCQGAQCAGSIQLKSR